MKQKNLVGEIEAIYKTDKSQEQVKITSADSAAEYMRKVFPVDKIEHVEYFFVLHLSRANKTLGWTLISQGGVAGTVCDPKIIFQSCLLANASGMILFHNHPSGNLKPSEQDRKLTNQMVSLGKMMDMAVFDHIILTAESYYSFANDGQL